MSWWIDLLKKLGLAAVDAGTESVKTKLGPKRPRATGKN